MAGAAAAVASMEHTGQHREPRRRRYRPTYQYRRGHFSLRRWTDAKVRTLCCFSKVEIRRLIPLLHLDQISWTADNHPSDEMAVCLLLCQLAYPERLVVISDHFSRSLSWCSAVFNDVSVHLWTTFRSLLEWHPLLDYGRMAHYAEAISDLIEARDGIEPPSFVAGEGSALFWSFVDGKFGGFCRPTGYEQQRSAHSSHKKDYGQKWQAVVIPDGLVLLMIGPYIGPINDWAI